MIDMGWGDYRLADEPNTRVTVAQVTALSGLEVARWQGRFFDIGASEVLFGEMMGPLLAGLTDGRTVEIGEDGSIEDVTREVVG